MELVSLDTAKILHAKDKSLYWQGVVSNFVNHYVYGAAVYAIGALFCRTMDENYSFGSVALQLVGSSRVMDENSSDIGSESYSRHSHCEL